MSKKELTKRQDDYSQWYLDVVDAADLAENSDVRGAMIIKPYGYAIWERMVRELDDKIKESGAQNVYFPLLIPKSYLSREADHVEGFAKECAVVTHHRLMDNPDGEGVVVDPEAKLEEEMIIRPTSETAIHSAFARWIQSYRDLPLMVNQWANVMRWEMRTRVFLRTSEFLWQEGHTAHATDEDAADEVRKMLDMYVWFSQDILAIPVIAGVKSPSETFAGAKYTETIETMMQDGKALQSATSHHLGTGFSEAFDVKFADENNTEQYAHLTSWGISTRIMGGLVMAHSDDKGLIVPPRIAPHQVVIVPIKPNDELTAAVDELAAKLRDAGVRVKVDDREHVGPGAKFFEWEKKGVPVRIEMGPRDLEEGKLVYARRDQDGKNDLALENATDLAGVLEDMQKALFEKASAMLRDRSFNVDSYDELKEKVQEGFVYAHWCGDEKCEEAIQQETKATTRCYPFDQPEEAGACVKCGGDSTKRIVFARSY